MNAQEIFRAMIDADFSRQSIDARVDEVKRQAKQLDDANRKDTILGIAAEIEKLIAADEKLSLAKAAGAPNFYNTPYSQIPTAKEVWQRI